LELILLFLRYIKKAAADPIPSVTRMANLRLNILYLFVVGRDKIPLGINAAFPHKMNPGRCGIEYFGKLIHSIVILIIDK
jgi:hypothetical protein